MSTSNHSEGPTPGLFFQTANAYQRTQALKAAVELDLFTAIGEGKDTTSDLAQRCGAAERGVRILADYLHDPRFSHEGWEAVQADAGLGRVP